MGVPSVQASSEVYAATVNSIWTGSFNSGWLLDQTVGALGAVAAGVSAGSSSTFFFSTGDQTAFYLPGRPLQIVQGANVVRCEVLSSSSSPIAGTTTTTVVTVAKFVGFSTGLSTGALTTIAASHIFASTGGASTGSTLPAEYGTQVMIRNWGL